MRRPRSPQGVVGSHRASCFRKGQVARPGHLGSARGQAAQTRAEILARGFRQYMAQGSRKGIPGSAFGPPRFSNGFGGPMQAQSIPSRIGCCSTPSRFCFPELVVPPGSSRRFVVSNGGRSAGYLGPDSFLWLSPARADDLEERFLRGFSQWAKAAGPASSSLPARVGASGTTARVFPQGFDSQGGPPDVSRKGAVCQVRPQGPDSPGSPRPARDVSPGWGKAQSTPVDGITSVGAVRKACVVRALRRVRRG